MAGSLSSTLVLFNGRSSSLELPGAELEPPEPLDEDALKRCMAAKLQDVLMMSNR
jgi:hypothetical protein